MDSGTPTAKQSIMPFEEIALTSRPSRKTGMIEIFRVAMINDVEAVTALTRSAYGKWVAIIGHEPLPMKADYSAVIRDNRVDLLFMGPDLAALIV